MSHFEWEHKVFLFYHVWVLFHVGNDIDLRLLVTVKKLLQINKQNSEFQVD